MSALGFFRKNTKLVIWIMVILMLMFLLSSVKMDTLISIFTGGRGKSPVVAQLPDVDAKLRLMDIERAKLDLQIYRQLRIGSPLRAAAYSPNASTDSLMLLLMSVEPVELDGMLYNIKPINEQDAYVNWALLTAEARAMGIRAEGFAVQNYLSSIGLSQEMLDPILAEMRKAGILKSDVETALANLVSVVTAFESSTEGVVRSEDELRRQFADLSNTRNYAVVRFDASSYLDDLKLNVSDEQRQAEMATLFEEGRRYSRDASDNPNAFRFGYRLPKRVQMEYALISLDAVESTIVPQESKLYDYWLDNKEKFAETDDEGNRTVLDYPAAKSQVRNMVRRQLATEQVKKISEALLRRTAMLQDEDEKTGEKVTGATALARAVEMDNSGAVSYVATPTWYTPETLQNDPVLQRSYSANGETLASAVFVSLDAFQEENDRRAARFKVGRVAPQTFSVNGARRGAIAWAVTAAKDSEAPETMDGEIAEQVAADWRVMKAYDIALAKARQAVKQVASDGIKEVAEDAGVEPVTLNDVSRRAQIGAQQWGNYKVEYARSSAFQLISWTMSQEPDKGPQPQAVPGEWYVEAALAQPYIWTAPLLRELRLPPAVREKVADALFALPPVDGELAIDAPAPAESVTLIETPAVRSVLVAQQLSNTPAYEEDFTDALRERMLTLERGTRRLELLKQWCSPDGIRARTGYVMVDEDGKPVTATAPTPEDESADDGGQDAKDQQPQQAE